MSLKMRRGWFGESVRHSLARRGVKTASSAKLNKQFKGQIKGGLSEGVDVSKFNPEQVRKGIAVEMEHTNDPKIAREIAYDHLTENPKYYDALEKIEKSNVIKYEQYSGFKTNADLQDDLRNKGLKSSDVSVGYSPKDKHYYRLKLGNPAEIKGQQVRIRVKKPKKNTRFRTVDVGAKGKLQVVLQDGETQSLRFNLKDYKNKTEFVKDLQDPSVRRVTTYKGRAEAYMLASDYFDKKKKT